MKNFLHPLTRRSSLISTLSFGLVIFLLSSSFKKTELSTTCSGPFYTGNPFGASFSILGPGGAGAPDEPGTCGRSSCHNTTDNSGPATFSLDFGSAVADTQYVPGKTYTLIITVDQPNINVFNFEITNRSQSGGSNAAGTFIITDPTRTKKTNGNFGGGGNNYVEGTACGIDALSNGT